MDVDREEQPSGGASFILRWLGSTFYGDDAARAATRHVLTELLVFYVFILIGFGALYLTWRSNSQLKEWKRELATAIKDQKGRKFEPQDAAKLYGMF